MAVGDLITAARYNNAQGRVEAILGVGSTNEGYGQTVASSQVSSNVIIDATHVNAMFTDLKKIFVHQTGGNPNSIAEVEVGDTVAEDTSGADTKEGFKDYEDFISIIETASNRFRLAGSQSSTLNNAEVIQRRNQWTAPIECEFQVSFADSNARRHFFNAGGSLTFVSSLSGTPTSGDSVAKSQDWAAILGNAGTVNMNYDVTTTSGSGVVQSIGNFDLTTSYQEIYRKSATGVYGNNNYILYAKAPTSSTIHIKYEFFDAAVSGYKIDEPVQGLLEAKIGFVRASGSNVDTPAPAFSAINSL
jgi:hypothetical protein|tara:strand:+ start:6553 stop:7461 length:909 start_codon:yes stop_codon:yes gene_type:complete